MFSQEQSEASANRISHIADMSDEELIRTYLDALLSEDHGSFGPKRRAYQAEIYQRGIQMSRLKLHETVRATRNQTVHTLH